MIYFHEELRLLREWEKAERKKELDQQIVEERKLREKKRDMQRKQEIFDRLVAQCIDEGRDFSPLPEIWYYYCIDGGEGDLVFPKVENLPFEECEALSDNEEELICEEQKSDIVKELVNMEGGFVVENDEKNMTLVHALFERNVAINDKHSVCVELSNFVEEKDEQIETPLELDVEDVESPKSAGEIEQLKDLRESLISYDPFMLLCDPLDFLISDLYTSTFKLHRSVMTALFTTIIFVVGALVVDIFTYVWPRLVFDRGRFGTNLLQLEGNDMIPDSVVDPLSVVPHVDPLVIKDGPVTRLQARKIREAMNALVHKIQLEYEEFPRDEEFYVKLLICAAEFINGAD